MRVLLVGRRFVERRVRRVVIWEISSWVLAILGFFFLLSFIFFLGFLVWFGWVWGFSFAWFCFFLGRYWGFVSWFLGWLGWVRLLFEVKVK